MHGAVMTQDVTAGKQPDSAHKPIQKPRANSREEFFAKRWARMAVREATSAQWASKLGEIIQVALPSARECQVGASFVAWLGTSIGMSFLDQAKACEAMLVNMGRCGHGYLACWAMENHREPWKNGGIRTIEYILAQSNYKSLPGGSGIEATGVPYVSANDLEVVDHLVVWLGGEEGQRFVDDCVAGWKRTLATEVNTEACGESVRTVSASALWLKDL